MMEIRVRSKTWLEFDGRPFLGEGRYQLLAAVARNGSINAAAKELGISFRKAWALLQAMEESSPFPILERRIGGRGGGASRLTPGALDLMERFEELRTLVNEEANRRFRECFDVRDDFFDNDSG